MTPHDRMDELRRLLSGSRAPREPAIEAMRPVVRSADQFLVGQPYTSNLTQAERRELRRRVSPIGGGAVDDYGESENQGAGNWEEAGSRHLLGGLLVEWGFDVVPAKLALFQVFLKYYEPWFPRVTPAGVRYRGTYAVASTTERTAGAYRAFWVFSNRAKWINIREDLDDGAGGPIKPFGALLRRYLSFQDLRPTARRSAQVYQIAWGANISP